MADHRQIVQVQPESKLDIGSQFFDGQVFRRSNHVMVNLPDDFGLIAVYRFKAESVAFYPTTFLGPTHQAGTRDLKISRHVLML